jgi:hypothetical protein
MIHFSKKCLCLKSILRLFKVNPVTATHLNKSKCSFPSALLLNLKKSRSHFSLDLFFWMGSIRPWCQPQLLINIMPNTIILCKACLTAKEIRSRSLILGHRQMLSKWRETQIYPLITFHKVAFWTHVKITYENNWGVMKDFKKIKISLLYCLRK